MNDLAQVIVAMATLVTALTAAVVGIVNALRINRVAANVQVIEKATNSMKDQLVATTAKASHAEGLAEGKAEEPLRVAIVSVPGANGG